ncbi:methyltransferase-like protein 27 [Glandiceps talaboti]
MDDAGTELVHNIRNTARSTGEIRDLYDNWVDHYDKDIVSWGWNAPMYITKGLSKLMANKDARILDCAAGTGLLGQEMYSVGGYTNIDAIDLSQGLLDKAKEKGIYKKLICAKLGTGPTDGVNEDTYDAIVCIGAFLPGHLDDSNLPEMARIVKKGGLICVGVCAKTLDSMEGPTLASLLESKTLEQVEKTKLENYLGDELGNFFAFKVL